MAKDSSEKANPERLGGAKLRDQSIEEGICNLLKVMVLVESAGLPITQVIFDRSAFLLFPSLSSPLRGEDEGE